MRLFILVSDRPRRKRRSWWTLERTADDSKAALCAAAAPTATDAEEMSGRERPPFFASLVAPHPARAGSFTPLRDTQSLQHEDVDVVRDEDVLSLERQIGDQPMERASTLESMRLGSVSSRRNARRRPPRSRGATALTSPSREPRRCHLRAGPGKSSSAAGQGSLLDTASL